MGFLWNMNFSKGKPWKTQTLIILTRDPNPLWPTHWTEKLTFNPQSRVYSHFSLSVESYQQDPSKVFESIQPWESSEWETNREERGCAQNALSLFTHAGDREVDGVFIMSCPWDSRAAASSIRCSYLMEVSCFFFAPTPVWIAVYLSRDGK